MGEGRKALKTKTWVEVHAALVEPPLLMEPPVPDVEAPSTLGGIERGGQRWRSWRRWGGH